MIAIKDVNIHIWIWIWIWIWRERYIYEIMWRFGVVLLLCQDFWSDSSKYCMTEWREHEDTTKSFASFWTILLSLILSVKSLWCVPQSEEKRHSHSNVFSLFWHVKRTNDWWIFWIIWIIYVRISFDIALRFYDVFFFGVSDFVRQLSSEFGVLKMSVKRKNGRDNVDTCSTHIRFRTVFRLNKRSKWVWVNMCLCA
jgi:hypothetical protein